MKAGLDIGYSDVKWAASVNGGELRRGSFASAVGTPELGRFRLREDTARPVTVDGRTWLYGQDAVQQSRFLDQKEDRHWYRSDAYRVLLAAALAEISTGTSVRFDQFVTGLPLAYLEDRHELREKLEGEHVVKRGDGPEQRFTIPEPRVVGQAYGALLNEGLDEHGRLVDEDLAGHVGVLDIGGHTTGILACRGLEEVQRESASVAVGGWTLVREVVGFLSTRCPELELRPHEVAQAIVDGSVQYGPEKVDISGQVARMAEPLAEQVISIATQLWNGGKALSTILIAGGGAYLLGDAIRVRYPHARVVADPVHANALGYWKLARRVKDGDG